ncbi:hypothetical protein A2276_01050 [candidate division WOR-1 bacterium RIFOXYA12_FULL_43_27]|uniref:Outer membrane protein beta-barrel domain-containing protein n=1 Tax=candidate division WOR-1 bacterium RIFOXYC2_FULL_46_14 TaxID=1802587 RepID=A0A1F4U6M5_UNCSA|nr:MAG: hypothetical protein A2276_01050 [candidate division WOR-1 bacterium RIFOXYA12_FULL_43_27]OGC20727.1 MAG: hypothetical protein A2292_06825 [candidate division WOR-1 bacterium RIFOXYB2_FULL_46_45]OGC31536.1 MAG: hypothetical protein A2232_04625 [candidate division WOR-1 bacterium RIFOXYA2_FULL_46_56]OGC39943.1 MAG: hypothetical protein A2438_05465 [candidate division WOR-1 bacterium RIFOXYC2_FULL_46_14]
MKKLLVLFCLLLVMASSSQALLSMGVSGAYYSYNGNSSFGYGFELGIPTIPLLDTRLVATWVPVAGTSNALIPTTINAKFGLPGLPVYVDAGIGYLFSSIQGATVTAGSLTYNLSVGYEQNFMPLSKFFIQGGYDGMNIDYGVGSYNLSGIGARAGLRFSI